MKKFTKQQILELLLFIFAFSGIAVSFILTVEKIQLLKNPDTNLSCSINSVINCASVMRSSTADFFGFPNPLIGLIFYSGMAVIALVLITGSKINKILITMVLVSSFISVIFSYFLLSQSVFYIRALCPYCLVSCFSATNIFFILIVHIYRQRMGKIYNWYIPFIALWYVTVTLVIVYNLKLFQ